MPLTVDACVADFASINSGLTDQASLIRLQVMEEVMLEDPWANLFEGGTVSPHEGETITTLLAGRPVLNKNMVAPQFVAKTTLCNTVGEPAQFGSEQYTTQLQGDRGESAWFCIHTNFHKLDRELEQHVVGLKRMVKEYMAADARYNLLVNSGHKYVASTALGPDERITGEEYAITTNFAGLMPNAGITHRELVRIMNYLEETARLTPFGFGEAAHARFVGSRSLIERLRNETVNHAEQVAFVQGGDAEARAALRRYSWAKYPYRGIMTAVDPVPLRFNSVDGNGFPVLITPYEIKVGDTGEHWVTNSEWKTAAFEVAFLVWKGAFKRLVPENFTRDSGGATWPAQSVMGELKWHNVIDNLCNKYGDRGQFIWEIIRAWQPVMPWAAVPILTKRCEPTDDLAACSSISD